MPQAVISPATSASSLIATGTPAQRPAVPRADRVRLGQRPLREDDAVGAEQRVQPGDLVERGLDDLARRHLAFADQARLLGGTGVCEICGLHAGERIRRTATADGPRDRVRAIGPFIYARGSMAGASEREDGVGACSDAERRRAATLARRLEAAGRRTRTVTLWVRPAWWAVQALCAAAGVGASVIGIDHPGPALAVAAAAAVLAAIDVSAPLPAAAPDAGASHAERHRDGARALRLARGDADRQRRGRRPAAPALRTASRPAAGTRRRGAHAGRRRIAGARARRRARALARRPPAAADARAARRAAVAARRGARRDRAGSVGRAKRHSSWRRHSTRSRRSGSTSRSSSRARGPSRPPGLRAWLAQRRRRGLAPDDVAILHLEPVRADGAVYWERDGPLFAGEAASAARRRGARRRRSEIDGAHAAHGSRCTRRGGRAGRRLARDRRRTRPRVRARARPRARLCAGRRRRRGGRSALDPPAIGLCSLCTGAPRSGGKNPAIGAQAVRSAADHPSVGKR